MELIAEHISKTLKGRKILNDISLDLHSGTVYGLVGRNGSGKTMLFRALSGLMRVDSGKVALGHKVLHKDMDILPNLGIIIENAGLYPELTGLENLKLLAALNHKIDIPQIRATITRVGLDPDDSRTFRKYSLGMKQRIILAQAIMEQPDILFLDEPTNALDEEGVEDIRKIIHQEKERGALVLIASHSKEDINLLSDQIFYMNNGSLKIA